MPIIYLAPANHYNDYCIAGYDEKTQCEKLAKIIAAKLAEYSGVTVKYTTVFAESRDYKGRPEEAAALGADYYIAVHDNAYDGKHSGAQAFYHPSSAVSKKLANAVTARLNAVCSVTPTFPNPSRSGMDAFNGAGYGEIREPYTRGIAPLIIEVNFHDYEPSARYLINNQDEQATAIVEAIAEVLSLTKTQDGTVLFEVGERVTVARNITVENNGQKRGRLFGGGTFAIYLDEYLVSGATRSDGRTVISDDAGNIIAAVYSADLDPVSAAEAQPASFPDVPASAWYAEAVNALRKKGVVAGYPDGTFRPEATATRAEVAQMIYRALNPDK